MDNYDIKPNFNLIDLWITLWYDRYMKLHYGRMTSNYAIGVYVANWGYPIKHEWEIGLYLFKWYIGIDFFK